jgi:hypothetical protein
MKTVCLDLINLLFGTWSIRECGEKIEDLEVLLYGSENDDWRAWRSPRSLRVTPMRARHDATPSGRGFGSTWVFGGGFCGYFLADGTEVLHHLSVRKTNHAHTEALEGSGAFGVSSQTFRGVMLRAVQFHDQLEGRAVEICDEPPNGSLPHPAHRLMISISVGVAWWRV